MSLHSSFNSFQSTTPTYPTTSHIPWNNIFKKNEATHFKTLFLFVLMSQYPYKWHRQGLCVYVSVFLLFYLIVYVKGHVPLLSSLPFALFSSLSLKQSLWVSGLAGFKCSQTPLQWSRLSPTPFVAPSDRTSPSPPLLLSQHHPYQPQPNVCSSQNIRVTVSMMTATVPMVVWGCRRFLFMILIL